MARTYLGQPVTIHGGGSDLIFPHHQCGRAQSESLEPGTPFVRYWAHVGMLRYEGEKMSKSLGNLVLAGDLLRHYSPDAIRLALLSRHYRESWEYETGVIEDAQPWADTLARALTAPSGDGSPLHSTARDEAFAAALDDDLDAPRAIQELLGLATEIEASSRAGADVRQPQAVLRRRGEVLGLTFKPKEQRS